MNYLIDTHAMLWIMFEPNKLSRKANDVLADKNAYKFISVTSFWEIAI